MTKAQEERLKEIIKIAYILKWIEPGTNGSYPWMQLSEVEKCMHAMVSDSELERFREWESDVVVGGLVPQSYSEYIATPSKDNSIEDGGEVGK